MIKFNELYQTLKSSGLTVVYDDYQGQKDSTPTLPFISYYVTESTPISSDNIVTAEPLDVTIELYTQKKDLELEKKIKSILTESELYYECSGGSNPERGLHIEYFEINILS